MKAVFLDRDGVIVEDEGFVHKVEHFKFIEGVISGLKLLKDCLLFIVTNQSGIGKGIYTINDFKIFNSHVISELAKEGITIQKTYFCPHKSEDSCDCRKPKTKFLEQAKKDFKVDLRKSFVIGDRKSDIELGKNAGCKTILVLTGNGKNAQKEETADFVAKNLHEAAEWIIKND